MVRSEVGGPSTWNTTTRPFETIDHASTNLSKENGSLKSWRA